MRLRIILALAVCLLLAGNSTGGGFQGPWQCLGGSDCSSTNAYGIMSGIAGEQALQGLYALKSLESPRTDLRKFYFSSEVGGDIPTLGADANDCLSIETPCLTFARAAAVCGGLSDCIFDAEDVWTGANVAADPTSGRAMAITTSSIGGNFVSTRIRSSNPDKLVHVDCVGTDWSDGEDGIFVDTSGSDWVSVEGWDVDCDVTALSPAHDQVDVFDGKDGTRLLAINVRCKNVASQGDEQCFTTHGTADNTGGLFVGINTEAEVTSAGVVAGTGGNIAGMNYESTMVFIGQGLFTQTAAATQVLMLRELDAYGARFYVIGHNFTATGNNDASVVNLSSTACTEECNYEFARVNVSDMVDNVPSTDTYLFTEAGQAGQNITLVTNQVTVANQTRAIRFNGAGGTVSWNGSGLLTQGISNYTIYAGAARATGGAAPLSGTVTECLYDDYVNAYYAGAAKSTMATFDAAMTASVCGDAGSVEDDTDVLLSNSSACDPANANCFNTYDGTYTIEPLFLGAAITFPADILGTGFTKITLSGGNIGGR